MENESDWFLYIFLSKKWKLCHGATKQFRHIISEKHWNYRWRLQWKGRMIRFKVFWLGCLSVFNHFFTVKDVSCHWYQILNWIMFWGSMTFTLNEFKNGQYFTLLGTFWIKWNGIFKFFALFSHVDGATNSITSVSFIHNQFFWRYLFQSCTQSTLNQISSNSKVTLPDLISLR